MLSSIITSKTKRKLLVLLFTNPYKKFYLRELSREFSQQPSVVRSELIKLENSGILISEGKANLKYYFVNRECPIYKELRGIILKTEGIVGSIKSVFGSLKNKIPFAFVFGSYPRGSEKVHSDIDLMIIGNVLPNEIVLLIQKVEKKLNREINYIIFPPEEFKQKMNKPFIQNVLKGKKSFVIGNENEFERFTERR